MTYVFDIDGTICTTEDGDYYKSQPITNRIEKINKLYDDGHTIIFNTARGMGRTSNNALLAHRLFYHLTQTQLESWGVKYNKLYMGKPSGDIYIDDKGKSDIDYFEDRK